MIRSLLIPLLLSAFLPLLPAQEPVPDETSGKGITSLSSPEGGGQEGATYAVVIGISDYQDEDIPDLQYAHRDAEAFAGFLQSPAGGELDEDHLKVLINEQATVAQFAMQLDWLWEVVQENDEVIIYFSGHGDVERKSITQPGYLLCWDAPARVYMAGGTFGVNVLNDVVSTLSIQNKARVALITDACRAGKLSGSGIDGAQATAANLAKQYANEIKILSCQPDEYSLEGEQWGGGRGAFSYHLVDGLYGLADRNGDGTVNLMELRGYLEERVSEEVAPESQLPMTVGNGRQELAQVYPELLEELQQGRRGQLQMFTATESRGLEKEVLAQADSNTVEMYLAFQESLDEQNFFCDSDAWCADRYYEKLSRNPQLERLHSSMRRNYAAALQDDAQQVMNRLLESNPHEVKTLPFTKNEKYGRYPEILRRAANLLGKEHYMYNLIMARSYWFEGYVKDRSTCACKNVDNAKEIIPYYKKALSYQPEMPHAWFQLAAVYGIQLGDPDKGAEYANKVVESIPGWTAIYDWVANGYLNTYWNNSSKSESEEGKWYLKNAKEWLDRGFALDSNSTLLYNDLGYYYGILGEYEKEQEAYARSLAIDTLANTLGYIGDGYRYWGKYEEAINAYQKSYELEPSPATLGTLITAYFMNGQDEKAEKLCSEILEKETRNPEYYREVGASLSHKYPKESIAFLSKALSKDSSDASSLNLISIQLPYFSPIDTAAERRLVEKASALEPDDPLYHCNIGLTYLRKNDFAKTKEKYMQAFALDSNYISIAAGMYLLHLQNGKKEEALKWLRKGMTQDARTFSNLMFWLCHRYLQHPKTADRYFEFIEQHYPENSTLHFEWAKHKSFCAKDIEGGFFQLEKALKVGLQNEAWLSGEPYIRDLRLHKKRWNALMEKYDLNEHKRPE